MAQGYRASWKAHHAVHEYWGKLRYYTYKGRWTKLFSHKKERMQSKQDFQKLIKEELRSE